jgi:hypothetical protein
MKLAKSKSINSIGNYSWNMCWNNYCLPIAKQTKWHKEPLGSCSKAVPTAEDLPSASFAGQMESFLILLVLINYLMLSFVVTFLIHGSCHKVPWYGFYKLRYCYLCWRSTEEAIKQLRVLPLLSIPIPVFKIRLSSTAVGVWREYCQGHHNTGWDGI